MKCTKGVVQRCSYWGSGMDRAQWCCGCHETECSHDGCRGPMARADVDAIANIDRLTAQIETLKRVRDEWRERHGVLVDDLAALGKRATDAERLAVRWEECAKAFERERDEARRLLADEEQEVELKQAALAGVSADRDARHAKLVEVADKLRAERAQVERLQESLTAAEGERDLAVGGVRAARGRVRVLETALRNLIPWAEAEIVGLACSESFDQAVSDAKSALTPATPAAGKCGHEYWRDDCADCLEGTAPPAETPAPTCPVCHGIGSLLTDNGRDGWECDACQGTGKAPPTRDASADAPDLWKCSACGRCTIEEAQDKATIGRLRAELAAANKEIAGLKKIYVDDGDAMHKERQAHAATAAKLRRAVAVLRCHITSNPCGTDTWKIGQPCKCDACAVYLDADGAQAAEACTAEREVIEAAKAFRASGVPHEHWVRLWNALDALAAVEARRCPK